MKTDERYNIKLENFEGPLEFLLYLVQKDEIDIYDVRLQKITDQFITEMKESELELGAEFVGTLASLIWLKSKMLLPKHEQAIQEDEEGPDPHFEVIHQLIDYCRFKKAGKALVVLEKEQNAHFARGVAGDTDIKLPLGIEHLSLEDLASLFQDIMVKAETNRGKVHEENFRVSDKISFLRHILKNTGKAAFQEIFVPGKVKEELIVTFLAVLELMKLGEACVIRETDNQLVYIIAKRLIGEDHEQ
ncbi:MAG: segregation/condensation protein A [Chlamydiota bacterium]|nr:segregation/condensation protein A [Chlamydiota bacterium]